jgi:hypothetical protein
MLRTLFHNGWSYAKIRSNQGYVGKVRAPARARSRARKLGYARGSIIQRRDAKTQRRRVITAHSQPD